MYIYVLTYVKKQINIAKKENFYKIHDKNKHETISNIP